MKITVVDPKKENGRRSGKISAGGKAVPRSAHKLTGMPALDVTKPTFTDDLTRIFKRNIAKARRENKKLFGSPNGF
jgi:hypothetical protein